MSGPVDQAVAEAIRDSWGQIVATLIGTTGDWDLAEESAQDAFITAMETWPRQAFPSDLEHGSCRWRATAPPTSCDAERAELRR